MGFATYDFGGETVVVTGASSGIGRAIALGFGDAGATVINADIREKPKLDELPTHQHIEEYGGKASYVETDISDREEVRTLVEAADEFGGLDVMVNNAGIYQPEPMLNAKESTLDLHYEVNIKGVFNGVQAAAQEMVKNGTEGSIVNMASISAEVAQGGIVPYEASKGAVKMITKGAAVEFATDGIRVNAVAPGVIPTELYEGYSSKYDTSEDLAELVKPIPTDRAGSPEEVARAVLFLASEEASYTTGALLFVDGGWMAI